MSYEDIAKVASTLLSQGTHLSVQRVRNELGTGSNTTIDRHLKRWQETFKQEKRTVLPETMPEELMPPLETFWQTAMARAEVNYQGFKQELQEKYEQSEVIKESALLQLKEQNAANQKLEIQLNNTRTENDSLKASLQHLEGEYKAHRDHVVEIKEQADQSSQLAKSSARDFQRQIEMLENALASQKEAEAMRIAELKARIRGERKRGEEAESRLLVEIDSLRQNVKQKDKLIAALEKESKALTQQVHEQQTELQVLQANQKKHKKELSDQINMGRDALDQAEKREINLQKQLTDITGLFEQMQQALNEAHRREMTLTLQVSKLETSLTSLPSAKTENNAN